MSQQGIASTENPGGTNVRTLTGNTGGPVGADAFNNINVLGDNPTGIEVVGSPGTNTLTIFGLAASTTQVGTVELATNAETISGVVTTKAITPDDLTAKLGPQTIHGVVISEGSSAAFTSTAAGTDGQVLIAATGLDPAFANLTAGANITITTAAHSVTIAANSSSQTVAYTLVNTSPYVVLSTDYYLGVDCSGGAITIELPNAPSTGRVFVIKDKTGSSATHSISVTTVGGVVTIDGSTTYTINTNYEAINVIFNGTSYEVF